MNTRLPATLAMLFVVSFAAPPDIHAQRAHAPKQAAKQPLPSKNTARVLDMFGKVDRRSPAASGYAPLASAGVLTPQTMLRTGEDSAVLLLLAEGHRLRIGEKSVVVLTGLGNGKTFSVKVLSGQVWFVVRGSPAPFEVRTPSAVTRADAGKNALFGVGYDLETNQSMVSTGDGAVTVSLSSGGWRGTVPAGRYVRYLRNPEPNIRLRAPEIVPQNEGQKTMWKLLRAENWTKPTVSGNNVPRLKRGQESPLRQLTFSVSVEP